MMKQSKNVGNVNFVAHSTVKHKNCKAICIQQLVVNNI